MSSIKWPMGVLVAGVGAFVLLHPALSSGPAVVPAPTVHAAALALPIVLPDLPAPPVDDDVPPRPRPHIVHNAKKAAVVEVSPSAPATSSLGTFNVTNYCVSGTMADGEQTHVGAVATISRSIPFGTRVLIEGQTYTVEDRIGYGSDFDIFNWSCSSAEEFGRHIVPVNIYN